MKTKKLFWALLAAMASAWQVSAQDTTQAATAQSIVGQVLDQQSKQPIQEATVELLNFSPRKAAQVYDTLANFILNNVPVGRYRVLVSAPGYESSVYSDILVIGGKETILALEMQESVKQPTKRETPTPNPNASGLKRGNYQSINTLSSIGLQPFTLDEVNRFSGSRSDVARLVTAGAGTINCDDGRNDIIARGGTPLGVQWRLEGMPIINPNHFGYQGGTTAGYFPVLNINVLANSEFQLGTFSAEYGNSTSGVFDINFRSGNKNRHEITAGVSLAGAELVAEGPLKKNKSSYLVAGRYSIIKPMSKIPFIDFGTNTLPNYYDLNFKFDFGRSRWGELSAFGYAGYAKIFYDHNNVDEDDVVLSDANKDLLSNTMHAGGGLKYRYLVGRKTYLQATLGNASAYERNYADFYNTNPDSTVTKFRGIDYTILQSNFTLHAQASTKFSSKYTMRNGLQADFQTISMNEYYDRYRTIPVIRHNAHNRSLLAEIYHQSTYKPVQGLTINAGVHGLYYTLNNAWAVDPRLAISYDLGARHRIAAAYAMQHQQLPARMYFFRLAQFNQYQQITGYDESAQKLGLMGNHYATLEYTFKITDAWQLLLAPYYRQWFGVPVYADSLSGYSMFNNYSDLQDNMPLYRLASNGKARQYGVDATLSKSFGKGFFVIASGSYFRSLYTGSDGVERSTRFNREYIARLRACKEWAVGKSKRNALFVSTTITYAGGEKYTPIDTVASRALQEDIFTNAWFSLPTPGYFRADVKIGMRINSRRRRLSHYFYLDIMNVSGHNNIVRYQYSPSQGKIIEVPQLGVLPDFLYRIQF